MMSATAAMAASLSLVPRSRRDARALLPRAGIAQSKSHAPVQITADQHILLEAREKLLLQESAAPKARLLDLEQLADHRAQKREELEALVRRARWDAAAWARYARWEESQGGPARARSVWERALDGGGHGDPAFWVGYAEFEMRHRCPDHARDVWDRAVAVLPRASRLWQSYAHMEEVLGNFPAARKVFERWMEWLPPVDGWVAYAEFELRCGEVDRARAVYERLILCHRGDPSAWMRYTEFEAKHGGLARTRSCYERAAEAVAAAEEGGAEELLTAFAEFEERCGETERARCVYRFAMERAPAGRTAEDLRREYTAFERRCRAGEDSVSAGTERV